MFFPINFSNIHILIVLSLPHSVKSLKSLSYGIFFFEKSGLFMGFIQGTYLPFNQNRSLYSVLAVKTSS